MSLNRTFLPSNDWRMSAMSIIVIPYFGLKIKRISCWNATKPSPALLSMHYSVGLMCHGMNHAPTPINLDLSCVAQVPPAEAVQDHFLVSFLVSGSAVTPVSP